LILIIVNLMVSSLLFSQKQDNKAIAKSMVENQLKLIYNYVKEIDPDSTLKRVGAIDFLEQLTKIQSESDTWGQIGKLDPTEKDYLRWKGWYDKNKEKLYWDSKKKKVICKPKCK